MHRLHNSLVPSVFFPQKSGEMAWHTFDEFLTQHYLKAVDKNQEQGTSYIMIAPTPPNS